MLVISAAGAISSLVTALNESGALNSSSALLQKVSEKEPIVEMVRPRGTVILALFGVNSNRWSRWFQYLPQVVTASRRRLSTQPSNAACLYNELFDSRSWKIY